MSQPTFSEIAKELVVRFSGQTFSKSEEALAWLERDFTAALSTLAEEKDKEYESIKQLAEQRGYSLKSASERIAELEAELKERISAGTASNLCSGHKAWPTCPNCEIERLQSHLQEAMGALEVFAKMHDAVGQYAHNTACAKAREVLNKIGKGDT